MPSRPVPSVGDRHPAMVPDRPLAAAGVPTRTVGA